MGAAVRPASTLAACLRRRQLAWWPHHIM